MLNWIIDLSLRHRFLVIVGVAVLATVGVLSMRCIPIDAFPDTTPVQVQVNTDVPGLVATEVERLVTFPVELVLGGLPGLVEAFQERVGPGRTSAGGGGARAVGHGQPIGVRPFRRR